MFPSAGCLRFSLHLYIGFLMLFYGCLVILAFLLGLVLLCLMLFYGVRASRVFIL